MLRSVEKALRGLVEGAFGRAFGGKIHPAEFAEAVLTRLRESERSIARRPHVANEFRLRLSLKDLQSLAPIEEDITQELRLLLRATAQTEGWHLFGPIKVSFESDPRASSGQVHVISDFVEGTPRGRLRVAQGPDWGALFAVASASTTIGRSRDCDIALKDPDVSRRHAVVHAEGDWFTIEDQNSTNGLFVNSERRTRSALEHGDFIEMGGSLLAFERVVP